MRILPILFLTGLSLSACTSTPVTLPAWDIAKSTEEVQHPLEQPSRPLAASSTDSTITFDEAGIRALERYHDAAVANHAIAEANAVALEAQSRAFNALIEAGKMQREVAVIRQQLLDREISDRRMDNLFHRGIILLGLLAAAL